MGADFVLTKISEELGDTEYVGVIAKSSKILQNTDDIERQIEECAVKRITTNGRKEIDITEIWVISNNIISQNAIRKIHSKYKLTKVKFIDNDRLARLVEKHTPDFMSSISIKESKFLDYERKAASDRDMAYSILPSVEHSLYVEQDVVREALIYSNPRNAPP